MILGSPWLKQAKSHHDWGNNTLTIIVDTKTMTLSTKKRILVHPSQIPCNLDEIYDLEGRLTNGDEKHLYHVVPKLWVVGKISQEEFKFLPKVCVKIVQHKNDINYPF
jgi:hypothetical protein